MAARVLAPPPSIAALCLSLVSACAAATTSSATDREVALSVADELERERSFATARLQLEAVVPLVDVDEKEELQLRLCSLWAREGKAGEARTCYRAASQELTDSALSSQARYRAASLALALGEEKTAEQELKSLIDEAPKNGGAHRALRLLRQLERKRGGVAAEIAMLLAYGEQLAEHDETAWGLAAESFIEAGRLELVEQQRPAEAAELLEHGRTLARGGVWEDDALIWQARARRACGDKERALELYHELIAPETRSGLLGSPDSEFFDDALLESGQTLRELGRKAEAQAMYQTLVDELPSSRLTDDAAFEVARIAAEGGDRSALSRFLADYPTSTHVEATRALLEGK